MAAPVLADARLDKRVTEIRKILSKVEISMGEFAMVMNLIEANNAWNAQRTRQRLKRDNAVFKHSDKERGYNYTNLETLRNSNLHRSIKAKIEEFWLLSSIDVD